MNREALIDIIRRELARQADNKARMTIAKANRPDDVQVYGTIDLLALAEAIVNR